MGTTQLLTRAGRAWPGLLIDGATFLAHLTQRLEPSETLDDAGRLHVEDLYLACGCVLGLPRALAAFDERHLGAVAHHLGRVDRAAPFADEVRQCLRERLLLAVDGAPPRLARYSGRGPLESFVQVAAIRVALNLKRGQRSDEDPLDVDTPMLAGDPEMRLLAARFRQDFRAAFADAVAALVPDERQLLRLHFLDGLTLGRIGALRGVDKSTVSRWLAQARARLFDETRHLLRLRLGLREGELDSLMRLVRSQLDEVSVVRLLRAG